MPQPAQENAERVDGDLYPTVGEIGVELHGCKYNHVSRRYVLM